MASKPPLACVALGERHGRVEHAAAGVDVQEVRAELLTDPEGAVRHPLERLDVDVGRGEPPRVGVGPHDRERDLLVRVGQGEVTQDLHAAGAAAGSLPARSDQVDPQQDVARARLAADVVVGHRPEGAVAVRHRGGEAGHLRHRRPGHQPGQDDRPTGIGRRLVRGIGLSRYDQRGGQHRAGDDRQERGEQSSRTAVGRGGCRGDRAGHGNSEVEGRTKSSDTAPESRNA